MSSEEKLLFDIWREVGRNLEIQISIERIALLVGKQLPFDLMLVQHPDTPHSCLELFAAVASKDAAAPPRTRRNLSAAELERLREFTGSDDVVRLDGTDAREELELLLPGDWPGEILLVPLRGDGRTTGLLLIARSGPPPFSAGHLEIAAALREPFTVALDNACMFREIKTAGEAAKADRHALLTKLGREKLGDKIVGADSGLRQTMERVEMVSGSDAPVLIMGETGSGKEVIARAVHFRSQRATGPFFRVNCGAIPSELIDSELFGHERGSFTGAVGLRKGWFEQADGGTLFLDEIGELPLAAQVRLLGVLQDGMFERVGGQRRLRVDVRVIAATNRDLQGMVNDGMFRSDLWFRIAVFPIYLPPLRDRPEDMQALATHFALRAAKRFGLPALTPTIGDVDLLISYHWPGNIRELAAVIDRAALLGNGRRLEISKAFGATDRAGAAAAGKQSPANTPAPVPSGFRKLDTVVREHIEAALKLTRGRIEGPAGAARLLGVNPHTLRSRMRKLGIDWSKFRQLQAGTE